jgi:hypothetical protein
MENLKEINHSHQNTSNQAIAVDTEVTSEEYHRIEVFFVLIIFLNEFILWFFLLTIEFFTRE